LFQNGFNEADATFIICSNKCNGNRLFPKIRRFKPLFPSIAKIRRSIFISLRHLHFPTAFVPASFDITFNSYTTDAQTAFQFAADIWGSILVSDVPIKINTYFTPLLPGSLELPCQMEEKISVYGRFLQHGMHPL
jgi:hypothetical protein